MMENVYHQKDDQVLVGDFETKFEPYGKYLASCSSACINNLLQKELLPPGIVGIYLEDEKVSEIVEALHVKQVFNLTNLQEIKELYLLAWSGNKINIFGSLLTMYSALKMENITLRPLSATHSSCEIANACPEAMNGYLYLLEDHWIVMRQLAGQWYKLDPCLGGPQMLTSSHVSLYIKQLLEDGNLVFLVDGEFPMCPGDANGHLKVEDLMPHLLQELSLQGIDEGTENDEALALSLSCIEEISESQWEPLPEDTAANVSTPKKKVQGKEEKEECCVCLEDPASHALVPCGHLCLCGPCSKKINQICPICKQRSTSIIQIYK